MKGAPASSFTYKWQHCLWWWALCNLSICILSVCIFVCCMCAYFYFFCVNTVSICPMLGHHLWISCLTLLSTGDFSFMRLSHTFPIKIRSTESSCRVNLDVIVKKMRLNGTTFINCSEMLIVNRKKVFPAYKALKSSHVSSVWMFL